MKSDPHHRHHLELATVAPWPHPPLHDAGFSHARTLRDRPSLTLDIRPGPSRTETDWHHLGVTFSRRRARVILHVPADAARGTPSRTTIHRTPLWTWRIVMPYASLVLLFALPPLALAASRWLRHHRRRPGLCPTCHYDLRATPDRCPECGTAAKAEPTT